jgi:dihydrolipoamide dehydrogenase
MEDIIIIGAGPGGYETAIKAAKSGFKVTIINDGPLGGVCLNAGCIPTKTFCHYAGKEEFATVVERKEQVVNQLRNGVAFLLKNPNITIVEGKASLKDANTVVVGDFEYQAKNIIIATGSSPASLPIPGADSEMVLTSTDVLNLKELPESICVIGGGVIGLEMACYLRKFGIEVTVLEYAPNILPNFDEDISKRLKQMLIRQGIRIETSAQVTAIDDEGVVSFEKKDQKYEVACDKVLMAVGRKPNTEGLNLEALGINYDKKGIKVNENMLTSVPSIYAIGDANGQMMLAHVASFQGYRALNHIKGKTDQIRFDLIPSAVFTTPEVASVGLTETQCDDKELDYRTIKVPYSSVGKAVAMGETDGFCKLIIDNENNTILGCHIMGSHASDLIQEVVTMMNLGVTLDRAKDIIHAHPTLSEIIQITINA